VLHEPAAGSLAPGLLDHVADELASGGVQGFGRALYGAAWQPSHTTASLETVTREFHMFRHFEPSPLGELAGRVTLTVGENSPPPRHRAVHTLATHLGTRRRVLPGVGHAAHIEDATVLASFVPTR
jgi:pimeloyl-ACP methyl ester carboxylesterase